MNTIKVIAINGNEYIDKEEVKYTYKFEIDITTELLLIFMLIVTYFYAKSENFTLDIYWYIFIISMFLGFILFLIKDIKTFIKNGIYVTEKYFFTFSGEKINLNEVYFIYYSFGYFGWTFWSEINFYQNKKFLFNCTVSTNEEYNNFINALRLISNNNNLLKIPQVYMKQKLVQDKSDKIYH